LGTSRSLRIVHLLRSPVGGVFRHIRDLAEYHAAKGHQVGIVCDSTTGGALEERYIAELAPSLALGVRRSAMQRHIGPGDAVSAWRTYRFIKELQPDILHGHGAKGGAFARMFGSGLRASGSGVARLYTAHGGVLHYDASSIKGRAMFAIERQLARFSDQLVFVSDYERRTFHEKIGRLKVAEALVYNGLRADEFDPVEPRPDAADFLYIGAMRDLKGPDLMLDAIAQAESRTGRALSAVMVGDGEDLPRYREQAERLGLCPRVTFLPPMPAREAFALARTIIVPSRAEAMPYIVLEALVAGKTMIATAVGGIPEIFPAGSPALVAPDAGEMAARMATLVADERAFAGHMPAIDDLRQRFGADVMADRIEALYLALAAKPR
jgi:glycosyltransferase involved in cell wall biosynthesis